MGYELIYLRYVLPPDFVNLRSGVSNAKSEAFRASQKRIFVFGRGSR